MRVVSICPSNTEIIGYLGLSHLLVGVDDSSNWPKQVEELPRLGPDLSIDMDLVEQLKPDLVLASLSVPGMEKNIAELEKRNLPFIVLNPQSFDDIEADILTTGTALGHELEAKQAAEAFRHEINMLKEISSAIKVKPSLYWEWWPKPVFTPGNINWLTELSELVGAYNIFHDVELASVQTDWEDVYRRNPDYICLAWVGVLMSKMKPELVEKRPNWHNLKAVQEKRILLLEEELYCRPSPRLLEGAKKLAAILHPNK